MTDRRFKAPDGQEYEESFLIERYGQEKFDAFVADQTFLEIPDGEQTILDEDEFTAPDGKKYSQSFLVERYGQEQFDTLVEDGTFKKKMLSIQTLRLPFQNFKALILSLNQKQKLLIS